MTIDGKPAYLWFVSPGQINLQAPNDTATGTGAVGSYDRRRKATSTVTLAQFGPPFCLLDSKHVAGIIARSNGSGAYGGGTYDIVGPTGTFAWLPDRSRESRRHSSNSSATGFGPTNPAVPAGQAFSGAAPDHQSGDAPHQQRERDPDVCRPVQRRPLSDQPDGSSGSWHGRRAAGGQRGRRADTSQAPLFRCNEAHYDKPTISHLLLVVLAAMAVQAQSTQPGSTLYPEVTLLPAGQFQMGDHYAFVKPDHASDEVPVHTVAISSMLHRQVPRHQQPIPGVPQFGVLARPDPGQKRAGLRQGRRRSSIWTHTRF